MLTNSRKEDQSRGRKQDRDARGRRLSIALHPRASRRVAETGLDDSGQSFELPPNRDGFGPRRGFGGPGRNFLLAHGPGPFPRGESQQKRTATAGTDDLRTSTKNVGSLREKDSACHAKVVAWFGGMRQREVVPRRWYFSKF